MQFLSGAFGQWIIGIAWEYILSEPKPKPSRFGVGVIIIMENEKEWIGIDLAKGKDYSYYKNKDGNFIEVENTSKL